MTQTIPSARRTHEEVGFVKGAAAMLLRGEGLIELIVAVLAYRTTGSSGTEFAVLFLAPDLAMLAYRLDRKAGAAAYNLAHTYLAAAALAAAGWAAGAGWTWPVALIWAAHIGFDRLLGYGLKYPSAFHDTHLGRRGGRRGDGG